MHNYGSYDLSKYKFVKANSAMTYFIYGKKKKVLEMENKCIT